MRVHIVGAGGIGLSALAQLLKERGDEISGCDRSASPVTERLQRSDISIYIGHDAAHISGDCDLVIYSDAIPEDHPERARAKELGIPQKSYFEALGEIANESKCLIAVAGSHGKTSTIAMLIDVLEEAGLNPTAIVGSLRAKTHSNFRAGGNGYFIVEADEYLRHFLYFKPKILVITNIDADHLDYYKDLADVQSAFRELAESVPAPIGPSLRPVSKDGPMGGALAGGCIVCDPNDQNVAPVIGDLKCTIIDYKKFYDPNLPMQALPLQRVNAAAALAVANVLKINKDVAKKALAEFAGTWRRFEYKGKTKNGVEVYDDYAHHPKEIATTLGSVREKFPDRQIIVAFQPHLYSRTKLLLDDFARAFKDADEVVIAPIFAAREAPDPEISSELLAQKISESGTLTTAANSLDEVLSKLQAISYKLQTPSLIITMGAGELYKVAEQLTK
ncbi:MAG: UDP-N-acetylmuramate--L-alanine ligase [Minisyncoccia bacterium]